MINETRMTAAEAVAPRLRFPEVSPARQEKPKAETVNVTVDVTVTVAVMRTEKGYWTSYRPTKTAVSAVRSAAQRQERALRRRAKPISEL